LIIVLVILAAALALAGPGFFGSDSSGADPVAVRNMQTALMAVDVYYVANGTYLGLDNPASGLARFAPGLRGDVSVNSPVDLSDAHFCLKSVHGHATVYDRGPGGTITAVKPLGCA